MKKENILFIGSFGGKEKVITGGQTFACRQFIDNPYLKSRFNFLLVDNLTVKKTSEFLFSSKVKNVFIRFFQIIYFLINYKFKIVIIYTSESFAFYEKGFYAILLKTLGKKIIFSPRSGLMVDWVEKYFPFHFAKIVFGKSDIVMCQGEFWLEYYNKKFNLNSTKTHIVRNFIQIDDDDFIEKDSLSSCINLIYIGWIHEKKGVMSLLEFIKFSKSILKTKLKICGEGDFEFKCREYCKENNLNDVVEFCGWVNEEEKSKLLSESHFILLLSETEGLPNSIIEGMKYGNIPIVTNVGSLNELVNSSNGYICENIDLNSILNFIKKFHNDPVKYAQVSKMNTEIIRDNFSNRSFENSVNQILKSLV